MSYLMEKIIIPAFFRSQLARKILWVLILGGSTLRVSICFAQNPLDFLSSDPRWHWSSGARLFHPSLIGAGDPVFYQFYLFCLRGITQDNRLLIALNNGLLSILMPWFFYRAGRELGLSKELGLCAWALIVWMPSLWVIYHYIMTETLLLPMIGLSLWMSARALRKKNLESWLCAIFVWTLTGLTKSTILPLAAVTTLYIWWRAKPRSLWILYAGMLIVILLIPNAIRTERVLGYYAPLGNPWIVRIQHRSGARSIEIQVGKGIWHFTSPSVFYPPLRPLSSWMMKRAWDDTTVVVHVDLSHGERDWRAAYANLNISPGEWWRQEFENILIFFFMPSWPDSDLGSWDGWLNDALRWLWAPLIFYIMDCNFREFWRRKFDLIPVATTALTLFLIFQNVATMEGRYRKPVEPLLLLNFVWIFRYERKRMDQADGKPASYLSSR